MAIITTANASQHRYAHIVDVLNNEFNCSCRTYQRGYWKPKSKKYVLWFPKVSMSAAGRGDTDWLDMFTDSTRKELTVIWKGDPGLLQQREAHAAKHINDLQVVFANILGTSGYEFIGVYRYTKKDAQGVRHYERVAVSIDTALCPPVIKTK